MATTTVSEKSRVSLTIISNESKISVTDADSKVMNSGKSIKDEYPVESLSANANQCTSSTSTPSTPTSVSKKRPYRRTRRPANYCDKSTVTTVNLVPLLPRNGSDGAMDSAIDGDAATTSANTSTTTTPGIIRNDHDSSESQYPGAGVAVALNLNAVDIVLQESQDLMQAAMEAQQLGRLKMASTYLLLLHARLVGLGKRMDNNHKPAIPTQQQEPDTSEQQLHSTVTNSATPVRTTLPSNDKDDSIDHQIQHQETVTSHINDHNTPCPEPIRAGEPNNSGIDGPPSTSSTVDVETPKTAAAKQLASMLPSNIEMDQAMMEHLAKAAAQLHAARSGKRPRHPNLHPDDTHHHHPKNDDRAGTSALLLDAREFLAQTVAITSVNSNAQHPQQGTIKCSSGAGDGTTAAATPKTAETQALPTATAANNRAVLFTVEEYQLLQNAAQSRKVDTKLLAQQTGRSEVQIKAFLRNLDTKTKLAQDLDQDIGVGDVPPTTPSSAAATTLRAAVGRGRKPTTTAITTVPNAICDARTLLSQGKAATSQHQQSVVHSRQDDTNGSTGNEILHSSVGAKRELLATLPREEERKKAKDDESNKRMKKDSVVGEETQ